MRTRLLCTLLACFSFSSVVSAKAKQIDLAICLDTSGSMDGLIDSAKIKLWAIVNDLAKVDPAPTFRVALLQYGNDGLSAQSGWVRKEVDLTTDLDEIYKKLNDLRTNGGTELVARVTKDALDELKWSEEKDSLRMIFVCGNEPANQDKNLTLNDIAELAKKKNVFINTIYCGSSKSPEVALWKQFAEIGGGKYNIIDQDKNRKEVVINTPVDKELEELNTKLNRTYVRYGGKENREKQRNQWIQDENAKKLAFTANLDRIGSKATQFYCNDSWDIIDRMKTDKNFDFKKLKEEELDEELRKIKPEEREAFLKKKAEERNKLQTQLQELSKKRADFIREELKKQPKSAADNAFDEAVKATIREQVSSKGFKLTDK